MTEADGERLTRRRLLELGGIAGAAVLVGCSGDDTPERIEATARGVWV